MQNGLDCKCFLAKSPPYYIGLQPRAFLFIRTRVPTDHIRCLEIDMSKLLLN